MRISGIAVASAVAALGLACPTAGAQIVKNPGPVDFRLAPGTETELEGSELHIYDRYYPPPKGHVERYRLFGGESAVLSGEVDAEGVVTVPQESMYFPVIPYDSMVGRICLEFQPSTPATGSVNPGTGEATLNLTVDTSFAPRDPPPKLNCPNPPYFGPDCRIPDTALELGTDLGYPYSVEYEGFFILADGDRKGRPMSISGVADCGVFTPYINDALGLPSQDGNLLWLVGDTDRVLLPA